MEESCVFKPSVYALNSKHISESEEKVESPLYNDLIDFIGKDGIIIDTEDGKKKITALDIYRKYMNPNDTRAITRIKNQYHDEAFTNYGSEDGKFREPKIEYIIFDDNELTKLADEDNILNFLMKKYDFISDGVPNVRNYSGENEKNNKTIRRFSPKEAIEKMREAEHFNETLYNEKGLCVIPITFRDKETNDISVVFVLNSKNYIMESPVLSKNYYVIKMYNHMMNTNFDFVRGHEEAFSKYLLECLKTTSDSYHSIVNHIYNLCNFFHTNKGNVFLNEADANFILELIKDGYNISRIKDNKEEYTKLCNILCGKEDIPSNKSNSLYIVLKKAKTFFKNASKDYLYKNFKVAMEDKNNDNVFLRDVNINSFTGIKSAEKTDDMLRESRKQLQKAKSTFYELFSIAAQRNTIYNARRNKRSGEYEEDIKAVEAQKNIVSELYAAYKFKGSGFEENIDSITNKPYTEDTLKLQAIVDMLDKAIFDIERLRNKLYRLNNNTNLPLAQRCHDLLMIQDYLISYQKIATMRQSICDEVDKITVSDEFKRLLYAHEKDSSVTLNSIDDYKNINEAIKNSLSVINDKVSSILSYDSNKSDYGERNITDIDKITYWDIAIPLHLKMLEDSCPDGCVLRLNGNVVNLKTASRFFNDNIGLFRNYLSSVANTPDDIMRIYDHIVKEAQSKARIMTDENVKKIIAIGEKYETERAKELGKSKLASIREHQFMYMHESNGKIYEDKFGKAHYISPINYRQYKKEYLKIVDDIYDKANNMDFDNEMNRCYYIEKEIAEWKNNHNESRYGIVIPKISLYATDEYKHLSEAQRNFYEEFMNIKSKMDRYTGIKESYYPWKTVILVRKTSFERFFRSNIFKNNEFWSQLKDYFNEKFRFVSTDVDFGGQKLALVDFKGEQVKQVPVKYLNKSRHESFDNFSQNCVTNLIMYTDMATKKKCLGSICNMLDMARSIFEHRVSLKKINGISVITKTIFGNRPIYDVQGNQMLGDRLLKRFDTWLNAEVYSEFYGDGKIGKASAAKVSGFIQFIFATMTLAVNVPASISNVAQGLHQITGELFYHRYYNTGDFLKANTFYWKYIWEHISEVGLSHQNSKMGLMEDKFNALQDQEERLQEIDFSQKTRFFKMFSTDSLFVLNNIGEHYLQSVTFLSLCNHEKLLRDDGTYVSILDAYKTEYFDKKNKKMGSYVHLAPYTYKVKDNNGNEKEITSTNYKFEHNYETIQNDVKDGIQFDVKDELYKMEKKTYNIVNMEKLEQRGKERHKDKYSKDIIDDGEMGEWQFITYISRKSAKINQDMHGIYTKDDLNMLQRTAIGRLAMMYRKYIPPMATKYFKRKGYDYDLQESTEGIYTTTYPFLYKFITNIVNKIIKKDGEKKLINMSENDKANLRISLWNVINFMLCNKLIMIMENNDWDDDEDNWYKQMMLLVFYRQRAEISMWTPLSAIILGAMEGNVVNPLNDWFNILQNPVVGMNKLQDIVKGFLTIFDFKSFNVPSENWITKSKTKYEKLPLKLQKQLYNTPEKYVGEEEYNDENGIDKHGDKLTNWDALSDKERRAALEEYSHAPSEGKKALGKLIPVAKPLKSSINPTDQLEYMQSNQNSDRIRKKIRSQKFSTLFTKDQEFLKSKGYTSKIFNELPSKVRIKYIDYLKDDDGKNKDKIPDYIPQDEDNEVDQETVYPNEEKFVWE